MEETCNDNNNELRSGLDWNKDEKYQLLQAIKIHGYQNFQIISDKVGTKSAEEVHDAIKYYKQKILEHPVLRQSMKKGKRNRGNFIPLADWAKLLTDSLNFKELNTETATALRMLADFEDHPPAVCTNNIEFKQIYHTLASALEGKAPPKDKCILAVLEKCLLDTALTSKAFIRQSSYNNIIKSINMSDKAVITFPRPTQNQELAIIRHLASQRTYNPINISEDFLKPS